MTLRPLNPSRSRSPSRRWRRLNEHKGAQMPLSEVRVGLIGCGELAQRVHLPVLASLPSVKVTALAECDPSRLAQAAALAPAATQYQDWTQLVAADDVDAVIICAP